MKIDVPLKNLICINCSEAIKLPDRDIEDLGVDSTVLVYKKEDFFEPTMRIDLKKTVYKKEKTGVYIGYAELHKKCTCCNKNEIEEIILDNSKIIFQNAPKGCNCGGKLNPAPDILCSAEEDNATRNLWKFNVEISFYCDLCKKPLNITDTQKIENPEKFIKSESLYDITTKSLTIINQPIITININEVNEKIDELLSKLAEEKDIDLEIKDTIIECVNDIKDTIAANKKVPESKVKRLLDYTSKIASLINCGINIAKLFGLSQIC